jgi:O-antigen/teichoic acid export membrane protein
MLFTSSMLFLMGNIDSFMIGYFIDEKNVGFYSACIKISLLITFILSSVNNYITPKISKAYHEKRIIDLVKIYKTSVQLIILSSLPIIIVIYECSLSGNGNECCQRDFRTDHLYTKYD